MQYRQDVPPKDQNTDDCRCEPRDQDCSGCYVQAAVNPGFAFRVEAVEKGFDRAIEKFCREHQADTADHQAPFEQGAFEDQGRGKGQGREEEVNEKAGVAANSKLDAADCFPKFIAPAPGFL
jgi:hypothetical protein